MAKSSRYHVISRSENWALKREGSSRAARVFTSKEAAVNASNRFREQNYDVVVHRADGTISAWHKGKK